MKLKASLLLGCSLLCAGYIGSASAVNRYIIIRNDMVGKTIYPVVEVPVTDENNCGQKTTVKRIRLPSGVASGNTVQINLHNAGSFPDHCWYNAGRLYIFLADIKKFEEALPPSNANQKTVITGSAECYKAVKNPETGKFETQTQLTCDAGTAGAGYPLDSPAQLTEYTFDADDPDTGKPSPDPDKGRLMTDIDISYVDETYLPISMAIDNGGLAGYMGTIIPYDDKGSAVKSQITPTINFQDQISQFLSKKSNNQNIWSSFAAYTEKNWNQNVFHTLLSERMPHTMGGYNVVENVIAKATSSLYKTTGESFLIENLTVNDKGQPSNPTLEYITEKWNYWLKGSACPPASDSPVQNANEFCHDFRNTVKFVWGNFNNLSSVFGYKSHVIGGQLPESVQAIMRGVPWNDPKSGKPQYQYDKWLLFWAPVDSAYNLNPFTRLIHNHKDGIDAVAYSFSIDDKYGNFRDAGTGFIIDVGGGSALSNQSPFDAYQQYYVSWPGGDWDHATICGRTIEINKRASNSRISMWQNGKKMDCDVEMFTTADTQPKLVFRVSEEPLRTVTDSYTGKSQQVQGLKLDNAYCKQNSTGTLQRYCDQANLSAIDTGETAYISLDKKDRPKTNLNLAKLSGGVGNINLAPGWDSISGCGIPANANPNRKPASYPLTPDAQNNCQVVLTSTGAIGVTAFFNIQFDNTGNVSGTCNVGSVNGRPCKNVSFKDIYVNVPDPKGIR